MTGMFIPERVRTWLHKRGLTDGTIERFGLGWNGSHVVIPITREDGTVFNKYRRDPDVVEGDKYKADVGGSRTLMFWNEVRDDPFILITEGELDAIRVWNDGGKAVTSTAGAKNWNHAWSRRFEGKEVAIWFDDDAAGVSGSRMIGASIARYADKVWAVRHGRENGKDLTEYLTVIGLPYSDKALRRLPRENIGPPQRRVSSAQQGDNSDKPSLELVLKQYGIKVDRNRHVIQCPLHDDSSPSFSYDIDKGLWNCFAGCGGGDVYTFVELMECCGFKEAKQLISEL